MPATAFTVRFPKWVRGTRFEPDFAATEADLAVAYQAGDIDADELDRRATELKRLQEIYSGRP